MKILDRVSGDWLYFGLDPDKKHKIRLAKLRVVIWAAVHTMDEIRTARGGRLVMYTLTYKRCGEWEPRHISGFVRWLRDNGIMGYTWVCELQKRGAVHYHVLALVPEGWRWTKPSEANGGWAKGFTWVTDDVNWPWYIMKYISKGSKNGEYKRYPKGIRLYAVSNSIVNCMQGEYASAYRGTKLPNWFRKGTHVSVDRANCRRVSGGVTVGRVVVYSPFASTDFQRASEIKLRGVQSV